MTLHSMSSLSGSEIPLDGLTILVGPNNAGKSQTLRDIHQLITVPAAPTVLVASLDDRFVKSKESYLRGVSKRPSKNNPINTAYSALDSSLQSLKSLEITEETLDAQFNNETWDWINTQFGTYRLAYLNAGSRLDVAKSGLSHDAHTEDPSTLLQQLYLRKDIQHELDLAFHQTFGMHVKLDYSGLKTLSLRVGYEFGDVPSDPSEAHPIMGKFPQLDVQGDGFRSFVGVVLSLLLSRNRIILLDEPEAFLHPEQARRLGRWLATDSAQYGGQVIVATHNSHFIQGLLSVNSSTRLVRLNRTGDCTSYRVVDTSTTKEFASSPLLSSQRVLEAVFHRKTVVCEADTDRMIYQTVALRVWAKRYSVCQRTEQADVPFYS